MSRVRMVAAALMVAAMVFVFSGCGFVSILLEPDPPPRPPCTFDFEEQTMTDAVTSRLDEEGLEQIYASCEATFDISDGQLLKTDVGLKPDDYGPDIVASRLMTLRLIGSKGTLEAHTDIIRFFAATGESDLSTITYFLTADTPEEFFEIIREGANAYGFDQESVERGIEDMRLYPTDESKFVVGTGYALGFMVDYDVRYRGPGHVNVIIVTVVPEKSPFFG